jgi:hypothetical protein
MGKHNIAWAIKSNFRTPASSLSVSDTWTRWSGKQLKIIYSQTISHGSLSSISWNNVGSL